MIRFGQARLHLTQLTSTAASAQEEPVIGIVIVALLVALAIFGPYYGFGWIVRQLAKKKIAFVIIPENTFAFVVTLKNQSGDITAGGGNVTDIIHSVPGKWLDKTSNPHDKMEWRFKPRSGQEIQRNRTEQFLFEKYGVVWIGVFKTLRTNKVRRFRYGKLGDEKKAAGEKKAEETKSKQEGVGQHGDYFLMSDDLITEFVPYSGELAIAVTDAETKDIFELNFIFNTIDEAVQPLKAVVRVADSNAILAGMVKQHINAITSSKSPEYFIRSTEKHQEELLVAANKALAEAEKEVGRQIMKVNLISTDMDEKDRELFERKARVEREMNAEILKTQKETERVMEQARQQEERAKGTKAATILEAEGTSAAQMLRNDADADRLKRVIRPMSKSDNMVEIRRAEAYENNKVVTTFVAGKSGVRPVVPVK